MMIASSKCLCRSCRRGVEPLAPGQCCPYLNMPSDWEHVATGRRISRHFLFSDRRAALAFANARSLADDETLRHPKLVLGWGIGKLRLTNRKIGGLQESDFIMVACVDALIAASLNSAWLPHVRVRKDEFMSSWT